MEETWDTEGSFGELNRREVGKEKGETEDRVE